jgi:hypothetical protein
MRDVRFVCAAALMATLSIVVGCDTGGDRGDEHGAPEQTAEAPASPTVDPPATTEAAEAESGEHAAKGSGEHIGEREHAAEGAGGDEESGVQYALDQTFDAVRRGVRLRLSWDAVTRAFSGTILNTTERTVERVRVEVHLSNGTELGPTTPADLAPGESRAVRLEAGAGAFATWSAHAESGRGEHGG